jgi:acetylornithine aminotransferase
MLSGFKEALGMTPGVKEIRGLGLMLGIELDRDCGDLVSRALQEHLLINVTAGNVVRLLPPLIISDAEAELIVQRTVASIKAFLSGG